MSEPTTTLTVLRFLAATYSTRWKPDAEQLATWAVLLADIPPDDLKRAAVAYAQGSPHPPTIADLRKLAKPDTTPSGDEAFDLARRASKHASPYSSERCSEAWAALEKKDPVAADACRSFGGFRAFWEMLTDDVPTQRAQFRSIYDSMQRQEKAYTALATAQNTIERGIPGRELDRGGEPRKLL